jgi:hypothetical protein
MSAPNQPVGAPPSHILEESIVERAAVALFSMMGAQSECEEATRLQKAAYTAAVIAKSALDEATLLADRAGTQSRKAERALEEAAERVAAWMRQLGMPVPTTPNPPPVAKAVPVPTTPNVFPVAERVHLQTTPKVHSVAKAVPVPTPSKAKATPIPSQGPPPRRLNRSRSPHR